MFFLYLACSNPMEECKSSCDTERNVELATENIRKRCTNDFAELDPKLIDDYLKDQESKTDKKVTLDDIIEDCVADGFSKPFQEKVKTKWKSCLADCNLRHGS